MQSRLTGPDMGHKEANTLVKFLKKSQQHAIVLSCFLVCAVPAHAQGVIYCCEDDNGRRVCGDVLPTVCYDRTYREMTPQGTVRRTVAAPLTAEEIARRNAEERRQREEAARQLVQRRLDQALLETYPNLSDIDDRETRALNDIERDLALIAEREQELLAQRRQILQSAGFAADQSLPREIENRIRIIDTELNAYLNVRTTKELEKASIRERFAADRKRYIELMAENKTEP